MCLLSLALTPEVAFWVGVALIFGATPALWVWVINRYGRWTVRAQMQHSIVCMESGTALRKGDWYEVEKVEGDWVLLLLPSKRVPDDFEDSFWVRRSDVLIGQEVENLLKKQNR